MLKSFIKLCKECLTMLKLQKMFFLLITIIMMNINISFAEKISMPYLYNDTNYVRIHEMCIRDRYTSVRQTSGKQATRAMRLKNALKIQI